MNAAFLLSLSVNLKICIGINGISGINYLSKPAFLPLLPLLPHHFFNESAKIG